MKKIYTILLFLCLSISVYASEYHCIRYKEIPVKAKISYDRTTSKWSPKADSKSDLYFIKTKGFGGYYDYLKSNLDFGFTTDCEYEFIKDGMFIGYSNADGIFYKFDYIFGELERTPLEPEEIAGLFPDFKIIKLSEFSPITNSLKVKKGLGDLKIIIYNDKNIDMRDFSFSTGNSEFESYPMLGFISIKKKGMIQFAKDGDSMKSANWFVLLVR